MCQAASRFLVLGLKGLVLRDLIETVKDAFPTLEADTAASEADLNPQDTPAPNWKYAFLNLAPDTFVVSEFAILLDRIGTKVILLGSAAEDTAQDSPYPVLSRPFSTEDILRLLK